MSLPMMISMLVQALYNIVDSIFVAQLSEQALTAVSLGFPLQNLMIAVGSGTGVGINAMLSKSLGEKRFEEADKAANTGFFLAIMSTIFFVLLGIFAVSPFINFMSETKEVVEYGETYLRIVLCFSMGLVLAMTAERILQSTGRTLFSMIAQLSGAIFNIIFDPILIFGVPALGIPRLGIAGAAIATVAGQHVAAVVGILLNVLKNKEIKFSWKRFFKPEGATVGRIYKVGVPSILMMSVGSVMNFLLNKILITFTETATAVFGAYFKMQSFFFMPLFGMNNGLVPIMAYNYGARNRKRVLDVLKFAVILAVVLMTVGTIIFETIPEVLLGMFNASEEMLKIGVPALRIIGAHFPLAAVAIMLSSTFQAFAKSIYSLIVSLLRQIVALIPAAYVLALVFKHVDAVWFSFLIAEVVSLIAVIIFYRKLKRDIIDKL
jgi:putative MATE family efflux protein